MLDVNQVDGGSDAARSESCLPALLAAVADQGWNCAEGQESILIMRRACRREALRWVKTAGWLTDEGLASVWEQMDRLVKSGRFGDGPGLLQVVVRRAYAGEAAAAQTGVGSPTTRGLIKAARTAGAGSISELTDEMFLSEMEEPEEQVAPQWMRTLAAVLVMEGWNWPVPALYAVMAAAAGVTRSGRRCKSALAAHETGVPSDTWSALELLTFGSGPGCQAESRTLGVSVQIDLLGPSGVRNNKSLMRIIAAAVQGRSVRTGRHLPIQVEPS